MNCYLDLAHISTDRLVNLVIIIILRSIVLAHAAVVSIERLNLLTGITNDTRERLNDLVCVSDQYQKIKLGPYQPFQPRNT
jgi:hypothetical protein